MPMTTATDADRKRDFQQLADAVFDTLAGHRAPSGLYADDAAVRDLIEQVLIDATGRYFSRDLDERPDRQTRARKVALAYQLVRHVLTYGIPSSAPSPHPFN